MKTTSFFFVAFVSTIAACGGSTTSPTNNGGPSVDQACTDSAKARCAKLAACEATGLQRRFGDEATCETREKATCVESLAASGTGNTTTLLEACVAAYPGWSCTDWANNVPPAACQAKVGTVVNGGACGFFSQCQSAFCSVPKGAACGTCASVPKLGDSCATGASCGYGLYCTKDTQVCAALVTTAGSACNADAACGFGLACVGASVDGTTKGKCQPLGAAVDAACDPKSDAAPPCDFNVGLWCHTGKCAKAIAASAGQPCRLIDASTFAYCTGGADCELATGALKGTCRAPAADGAPCDSGNGPFCLANARCVGTSSEAGVTGTCKVASASSCK